MIDHEVLRQLSHITIYWELTWDSRNNRYEEEPGSFANVLNALIQDLTNVVPPKKYHDNEDRLAEYVIKELKWNIRKKGNIWIGADYESILSHGGFNDIDEKELVLAAAGRIAAAIARGQLHYDEMEESHRKMLGAVLTVILYHRHDEMKPEKDEDS